MQITLRVTPDVYDAIKATATADKRSINRQIEHMIEEWLRRREREAPSDTPHRPTV